MAQTLLYRYYLIVASSRFDNTNQSWTGTADISWGERGSRGLHTMMGPKNRHSNERDAESFIIRDAKNWINAHSQQS